MKRENASFFAKKKTITVKGKIISFSRPLIMGILNLTEDSFYDGGRYSSPEAALEKTSQMIEEGADIIDIGAFSSKPGNRIIPANEEQKKLIQIGKVIREKFPEAVISVDTCRAETARLCYSEFGVDIINDISGGMYDEKMFETIAQIKTPYILMHMKGTPENMQDLTNYSNIFKEISLFFSHQIRKLEILGVKDIILDPGFGFSKTIDQNYELLNKLDYFKFFEFPILFGCSRKSMIWKTLKTTPGKALNGTTVLNVIALQKGADILRVHDVKEAYETITLLKKMENL